MKNFFFSKYINKSYLLYGGSIIIARGLEFFILLLAARLASKEVYGELEFYKKIIEVFSILLAFGFPTLIMTYTRSKESKKYFLLLSLILVALLGVICALVLLPFNLSFLVIPLIFYAIFFQNGVIPVYLLVNFNSEKASFYKIVCSLLFYSIILILFYFNEYAYSFVWVGYLMLPIGSLYLLGLIKKLKIERNKLIRYWNHLKKLLYNSFTLVISKFSNMMFLYTDVFIISFLSSESSKEIANYSFPLNIANTLLIIPLTIVQVEIENIKKNQQISKNIQKRIFKLALLGSVMVGLLFLGLINSLYAKYSNTSIIFILILIAKIIQSSNVLLGTKIAINKMYNKNLLITSSGLILNFILSYYAYTYFKLMGIAGASILSLVYIHIFLTFVNNKYFKTTNQ